LMLSPLTAPAMRDAAHALLAGDGVGVTVLRDSPGFVVQRVLAMIVNLACCIASASSRKPANALPPQHSACWPPGART
ncbi:hypothetical protein ACXKGW_29440, partial [Klebsiella pneumoniae subsp. pneumoniae]